MFALNAKLIMKVGIAGTFSAIKRHADALKKMQDIQITGCWSTSISTDIAVDIETKNSYSDPDKILEKADAFIITDSGIFNNQLAISAIRHARHVFLYPSVLKSTNEGYQLIKLAREANVILKCGRTGNFEINGLLKNMSDLSSINLIEFNHEININKNTGRNQVSNIILADIEIINKLIRARNTSIKVKGFNVLSKQTEIISARLEFDNGGSVNYFCNILGTHDEHCITIISKDRLLKYSVVTNELSGWYLKPDANINEKPVFINNLQIETTDCLFNDINTFFSLINTGPAFLSIYDNGLEPFLLTDRILEKVSKTLIQTA